MEYLKQFISELILILTEMSPYLILGFLMAGILYLLFPKSRVKKLMGRDSRGAVINASLLGIPLPLCSCGVIPTGISFYKNGASKGSTVSFLISTPQTGVDSILVTYSLLGLPFAIIRPIVALFTGIIGGFITDRTDKTPDEDIEQQANNNKIPKGFFPKIKEMFRYAFIEFLQDISTWLVGGLLLAALISVIIPDNFFAGSASNDTLEMLIILVAAIPVYICATASVPIAAVLLLKGLSPGAALVLLMAGPATNAATITMIGKVLGRKTLMTYLGSIIGGALLFGFIINSFLPPEWFSLANMGLHAGHEHHLLPAWLTYGSAIALVLLIINGYLQKYLGRVMPDDKHTKDVDMSNITKINVQGMTCNHCKANVENGINGLEGISSVTADITSGNVVIEAESVDLEQVKEKVESLGYKIK